MRIETSIHCGEVVSLRTTDQAVFTETEHTPGSALAHHAHVAPHLAVLLEGAYFERMDDGVYLRLPGDEVYYPEFSPHENRFGRLPAKCLNIETRDGSFPLRPRVEAKAPHHVRRARDIADQGRSCSLSTLADAVGYHPVYLARAFRKAFGNSVGEYLKVARMRKAAELIFKSDSPLADIALEAGYFDQSHLTNELARFAGFTPGELRRLADR